MRRLGTSLRLGPLPRIGTLVLAGVLAVLAVPARADEGTVLRDRWTIERLQGVEMGRTHSVTRRVSPENVRTEIESTVAVNRAGTTIELRSGTRLDETADGVLTGLRHAVTMSGSEMVTEATVDGGVLHVRQTVYGKTTERSVAWPDNVLGPYGVSERVAAHLGEPGATFSYRTLEPDVGMLPISVQATVVGPVEKDVLGESRRLVEVREQSEAYPGVELRSWYRTDGRLALGFVPIAGGAESITVSRERALAGPPDGVSAAPLDTIAVLAAPCNVDLDDPYRTRLATYRIDVLTGDAREALPDLASASQQELRRDEHSVVLAVHTIVPSSLSISAAPLGRVGIPPELAEYARANSWLQSDDPKLREAVQRVVGDEPTAWRAAKKLERWVYDWIRDKNMSVGFATAEEAFERRAGDCTEHAVLLAAALRAAGIPSRVVMGMVYYRPSRAAHGVFAHHAWVEAWIGDAKTGGFVPFDATLAEPVLDAVHIGVARSSLEGAGFEKLFLDLSSVVGNTRVTVLDYEGDGRKKVVVLPREQW